MASLVITVSRPEDVDEAARVLTTRIADFHVDRDARRLTAPSEGVSALAGIAAAFTEAGIELDDIGLQRPSLDDVFLSLTGRKAEDPRLESGGDDTARSDTARSDTARSETASLGTTEEEYRV